MPKTSFFSFESDSFTISSILETLAIGVSDEYSLERVISKTILFLIIILRILTYGLIFHLNKFS